MEDKYSKEVREQFERGEIDIATVEWLLLPKNKTEMLKQARTKSPKGDK